MMHYGDGDMENICYTVPHSLSICLQCDRLLAFSTMSHRTTE